MLCIVRAPRCKIKHCQRILQVNVDFFTWVGAALLESQNRCNMHVTKFCFLTECVKEVWISCTLRFGSAKLAVARNDFFILILEWILQKPLYLITLSVVSMYPESPATGHLNIGLLGFPPSLGKCWDSLKKFQIAATCVLCSSLYLNS